MSELQVDALAQQIFEGRHVRFQAEFTGWLTSSRRFRSFAETYQSKIRKKLRIATEEALLLDLRSELETVYRLLQERNFSVEYEKHGQGGGRAPDLTVTYRTRLLLNIEVTRPRVIVEAADKLLQTICDKVGQLRAGDLNLLLICAQSINSQQLDEANRTLRLMAERKDDAFFARRRFIDAKSFLRQYQHLSAIGLKSPTVTIWANPLAKKPLPDDLHKTLLQTL